MLYSIIFESPTSSCIILANWMIASKSLNFKITWRRPCLSRANSRAALTIWLAACSSARARLLAFGLRSFVPSLSSSCSNKLSETSSFTSPASRFPNIELITPSIMALSPMFFEINNSKPFRFGNTWKVTASLFSKSCSTSTSSKIL